MTPSLDRTRLGYWPSPQMAGDIPPAIRHPDEYAGGDVLNITCTQTGLPASQQRRIVTAWIDCLPTVTASTVVFSSKVPQELFDVTCTAPKLQALNIKWSSCTSLTQLKFASRLRALFLGSSPGVSDLGPIAQLHGIQYLFIENAGEPVDLHFIRTLCKLREFGLSASRGHRLKVCSLEPLTSLPLLEMLWLISLQIDQDGLLPLHRIQTLRSLRTTIKPASLEFKNLCAAVPSLKYCQPVG